MVVDFHRRYTRQSRTCTRVTSFSCAPAHQRLTRVFPRKHFVEAESLLLNSCCFAICFSLFQTWQSSAFRRYFKWNWMRYFSVTRASSSFVEFIYSTKALSASSDQRKCESRERLCVGENSNLSFKKLGVDQKPGSYERAGTWSRHSHLSCLHWILRFSRANLCFLRALLCPHLSKSINTKLKLGTEPLNTIHELTNTH